MLVTELITRMNDYSLDHELEQDERALYLRCLNEAYSELYLNISAGSDYLTETIDLVWDNTLMGFAIPNNLFELRNISTPDNPPLIRFYGNIQNTNFTIKNYVYLKNKIVIHPNNNNRTLTIDYIPKIKKLVEVVNDLQKEANVPAFDEIFHYILVLGALRPLYESQRIFFEKLPSIENRYINGLKRFGYHKNYGNNG